MANWYDSPSTVHGLRWAPGLYVPNRSFRDYNDLIYTGTFTGDDGKTWEHTGFPGWYEGHLSTACSVAAHYTGTTGYRLGEGWDDHGSIRIFSVNGSYGTTDYDDHNFADACVHTGMIPFSRFFASQENRSLGISFVAKSIGGNISLNGPVEIVVSQYNSSFTYLATDAFSLSGTATSAGWTRFGPFRTSSAMSSSTTWIKIQIGLTSSGNALVLDEVSLFINPFGGDDAGGSASIYEEITDVFVQGSPAPKLTSAGLSDRVMLDGHMERFKSMKGGPKGALNLAYHAEDGETVDSLRKLYATSTDGWGRDITEPVPVCVEPGFGGGPFWGYYHAVGDFSMPFTKFFSIDDPSYDAGLRLVEV